MEGLSGAGKSAVYEELIRRGHKAFSTDRAFVELMLELNRSDDGPAGAIEVDATQPLDQVVDELLRLGKLSKYSDGTSAVARRVRSYIKNGLNSPSRPTVHEKPALAIRGSQAGFSFIQVPLFRRHLFVAS